MLIPTLFILFIGLLFIARVLLTQTVPFVERHYVWSIGIYSAKDLSKFSPAADVHNPVITADHVTDIRSKFVADPFMIRHEGIWYLFFESYNIDTKKGEVGLSESRDGVHWQYRKTVLKEPYHLSYPYVFRWNGVFYMIPETVSQKSVRLYRAERFPDEWRFERELLSGELFNDSSIVRYQDLWWIFAGIHPAEHDALCLYYADDLFGPWKPHARNPLISNDAAMARPGGRPVEDNGALVRFTQDDQLFYGRRIRAFRITRLTPDKYEEREIPNAPVPEELPREAWNRSGMHSIDPHRLEDQTWLACVDGFRLGWRFGRRRKMLLKDLMRLKADAGAIRYAAERMNKP